MAGRGRAPSTTRARERDQRAAEAKITVIDDHGGTHGPELPDSIDWPDATRDWWGTWRTAAQASTFTDTDWAFLLDTAVLHMAFWDGDHSVAAELRLRAAKFGATPEDRARLKLSIGKPDKPTATAPKKKTPAARTRRARVLKAVGDE